MRRGSVLGLLLVGLLCLDGCKSQPSAPTSAAGKTARNRWHRPTDAGIRQAFESMPVYERLETFESTAEFEAYRRRIEQLARAHDIWWLTRRQPLDSMLLVAADTEPCDPSIEDCPDQLEEVVTTAQRVSRPASITNNQVAEVDEGDIVKSWRQFLIVLHDARLFSVDLGDTPGHLRLADRVDAYQSTQSDAWYDELLIKDNHVLVTGYSYSEGQAEYSVFDIDSAGRLRLASRFFIKSADYFSGNNYASRLVGGRLVIYNPVPLSALDAAAGNELPQVRSWRPGQGFSRWRPLLRPTDIYRPVDRSLYQIVHVVSDCPILSNARGECRSQGVVASVSHELYVGAKEAFLWVNGESAMDSVWSKRPDCTDASPPHPLQPRPATVFRMPLGSGSVTGVRTRGDPPDQFAMELRSSTFYSLVRSPPFECWSELPSPLELFAIPVRLFSDRPASVPQRYAHALPQVGEGELATRFAANHLGYGAGAGWWSVYVDDELNKDSHRDMISVPLRDPERPTRHRLAHSVERIEAIGENLVVFGINARKSLGVSTLDLRSDPVIAGAITVPRALESEGRSHAFNARIESDGSGLLGLPIVVRAQEDGDNWYHDVQEQVIYFGADAALRLRTIGSLMGDQLPDNPDYKCDMSCVDWYGNTRPIFYNDRVFALIGREFAEGRMVDGGMIELARLDLTRQP